MRCCAYGNVMWKKEGGVTASFSLLIDGDCF